MDSADVRARSAEPGPLRLVFLASVTPLKGLHVLLRAISARRIAVSVAVIGSLTVDPGYAREMQRYVVDHDLSSAVHFRGILDGDALAERLKTAQVVVIPSSYEGFGISYLEGMAFGLPAIGTTAGAIPQLITDGENGYLIAPGDSEMLAQRLQGLASDRGLLTRLSLNARRRFDDFQTWEAMGRKIRDFLSRVVQGEFRAGPAEEPQKPQTPRTGD
jgi:glycosyltransferase involved in cell wall biosynthesis